MNRHRYLWIGVLWVALMVSGCQPVQAPGAASTAPTSTPLPSATEATATDASAAPDTSTPEATTPEAATPEAATPEAATPEAGQDDSAINEVAVTAAEYSFDLPASIPAGWTRFTLENQGAKSHDFTLMKLGEGKTLDDLTAALQAEGPPEWVESYGMVAAEAGARAWLAVKLDPGTYAYMSSGGDESGPDAAQGMLGTLTVTEATGPVADQAPVTADVAVDLVDFQFVVDGTFQAGEQVMRVANAGTEPHEIILFKLKEGKTQADFMAALEREMSGEEVPESEIPGDFVGGTFLSPGREAYSVQAMEPGEYLLVCFIPSPEHEMKSHAELGMIQQVTVE